jgi:hypothetical protein
MFKTVPISVSDNLIEIQVLHLYRVIDSESMLGPY